LLSAKARGYYLGAAYPMLIAMGAVLGERWVGSLSKVWRRSVGRGISSPGSRPCGLLMIAIVIPLASSGPLMKFALENNGDLREEIGWGTKW